jgi:hypothetical protein
MIRDSLLGVVSRLLAGQLANDSQQGQETIFFFTDSRPTLGILQPSIKEVPRTLYWVVKLPGLKLAIHHHFVPSL